MSVLLKFLSGPAGRVAAAFALGMIIGGFWRQGRNAEARRGAQAAQDSAEALRVRVALDSTLLARSLESYDSLVAHTVAAQDSQVARNRELAARASDQRARREVAEAKTDSLLAGVDSVIAAAVEEERALSEHELDTAHEQFRQMMVERDQYHLLWMHADSLLAQEASAHQRTRDALAAQVRATDAWKKAAAGDPMAINVLKKLAYAGAGYGLARLTNR